MGVAGSGKTSVGERLAPLLGGVFLDGDAFHPPENIAKMSHGVPLTDADRWAWLERIGRQMAGRPGAVVAGCSALKRSYREAIRQAAGEPVLFVHLAGSRELIEERMAARTGHFMPTSLLDSQFAALEPPGADEDALTIDIAGSTDEVVTTIAHALGKAGG